MTSYAGLDVAEQATQICVISEDSRSRFVGKCTIESGAIAKNVHGW